MYSILQQFFSIYCSYPASLFQNFQIILSFIFRRTSAIDITVLILYYRLLLFLFFSSSILPIFLLCWSLSFSLSLVMFLLLFMFLFFYHFDFLYYFQFSLLSYQSLILSFLINTFSFMSFPLFSFILCLLHVSVFLRALFLY